MAGGENIGKLLTRTNGGGRAPRRTAALYPPGGTVIVCDEFAAVLDRLTAMIVARCLRRAIECTSECRGGCRDES